LAGKYMPRIVYTGLNKTYSVGQSFIQSANLMFVQETNSHGHECELMGPAGREHLYRY